MLVDLRPRQIGEVEPLAGIDHRAGEMGRLGRIHAAEEDRHEQGGRLVVGPAPIGDAAHEGIDLDVVETMAVTLLAQDVDRTHAAQSDEIGELGQGELADENQPPVQRADLPGRLAC